MFIYKVSLTVTPEKCSFNIMKQKVKETSKTYNYDGRRISKNKIGEITDDVVINNIKYIKRDCWLLDETQIEKTKKDLKALAKYDLIFYEGCLERMTKKLNEEIECTSREYLD